MVMKEIPSIFNDVIGPVMRGPSSSHTAASVRMARLVRQMLTGKITRFINDFDKNGSLATTYHGHGSDIGLAGGILDMEPNDPRIVKAIELCRESGMDLQFNVIEYEADHPNTYKMTAENQEGHSVHVTAISIGGGMIELTEIQELSVSVKGDFYETLVFFEGEVEGYVKTLEELVGDFDAVTYSANKGKSLINIKTQVPVKDVILTQIGDLQGYQRIMTLSPVLPTMSHKDCKVPYLTAKEMLEVAKEQDLALWEAAVLYESQRGNMPKEEVFTKMKHIVEIMVASIKEGLAGTEYEDRILGPQAYMINEKQKEGKLIEGRVLNSVIASITAMMEVKSSMGVIVAAPTAGACGGLPGTIVGAATELGYDIDTMTKGMLAAGMIGIFIAEHATFAGEVGGCQAECGSGSGMAAAGLVQMMGGTIVEAVDAASVGLQNILGLACDPVGARVEVPCLGRNVLAGSNAISSANMVLAGYDKVVPLDETIKAMEEVGSMIPPQLRCTELAGLSISETSLELRKRTCH